MFFLSFFKNIKLCIWHFLIEAPENCSCLCGHLGLAARRSKIKNENQRDQLQDKNKHVYSLVQKMGLVYFNRYYMHDNCMRCEFLK